tara:strand:- start:286 stop:822 length:537 start_codon:yes stop_codon:yes gene_type:complete
LKFLKTEFKGLYVIEPKLNLDDRGFFIEIFRKDFFEENLGYSINFCQHNLVSSNYLVLRGLHFQQNPHSQSKLISVSNGNILDVVVDIRKESSTYGKYFSIELSSNNKKALYVPKGFAHGYLTLSEKAIINYSVDNYYNKNSERGISYDDKFLNINWGVEKKNLIISPKDKNLSEYKW